MILLIFSKKLTIKLLEKKINLAVTINMPK